MNPKYPIYIISKGRWENCPTAKWFEKVNIPYHVVIEPCEYKQYSSVINEKKIYTLPFENLGQGSIPARNWVWDHAVFINAAKYWIIDDNIYAFNRLNNNRTIRVFSGATLKAMEDFTDRYENVVLSGPDYRHFARQNNKIPPYVLNTRIYSCILIKTSANYRWRGKYNEDTDLSLRVLKDGYCTILFKAFPIDKVTTMTMKGGNTDNVYIDNDHRRKFAESLVNQHPDCVKVVWKWNRWQHHVDYKRFKKNKLIKKNELHIPVGVDNYGMKLIKRVNIL